MRKSGKVYVYGAVLEAALLVAMAATSLRSSAARIVSRVLQPSAGTITTSGRSLSRTSESGTRRPWVVVTVRVSPQSVTS